MRLTKTLHMHRGREPIMADRKAISNIHRTVEPILEAFQLDYTRTDSSGRVSYQILRCRALEDTGINPDHRLVVPVQSIESFSLSARTSDDLNQVVWAAGVEAALACRQAGLIRNLCDPTHWERRPNGNTPRAVTEALRQLNLEPGIQQLPVPNTDELGKTAARRLLDQLGPGYHVLLFGSRQRGDHRYHSDVDLLIQPTQDCKQQSERAYAVMEKVDLDEIRLLEDDPPYFDVFMVDHWEEQIWQEAHQRLNPDGGTVTAFAHQETPAPQQDRMPVQFLPGKIPNELGALGYLLTSGVTAMTADRQMVRLQNMDQPSCKR